MTDMGIAIAIHLLGVLWWIGGLAFVTLIIIPLVRSRQQDDLSAIYQAIESRFAPQARVALVLVGLSGGYLMWRLQAWQWLTSPNFWWLNAMIAYWCLFAVLLFVLAPLGVMSRIMRAGASTQGRWRRIQYLHATLLILGLIIVGAAAAGSHGW